VVVPVRDGAEFLPRSLAALEASDLPREDWELIVVDDGSRDDTVAIAERYADRLLRQVPASGPPAARNLGAAAARAPIVVFVDADVQVHPDALGRIRDALAPGPGLSAVFGAYDLTPAARGLVSQYRNLLHSYVHRRDAGRAVTFWTGLGGIRRDVLEGCGGFDPGERLDDVELGYRVSAAGHRILLDPEINGTHLKRWTLWNLATTDVLYRGVPWVRLLLRRRPPLTHAPLNLRGVEQVLTLLMAVALLFVAVAAVRGESWWLVGTLLVLVTMVGTDARLLGWLVRVRGWRFAVSAAPLRLLYFALNLVAVGLAILPVSWRRRPAGARLAVAEEHRTARLPGRHPSAVGGESGWEGAVPRPEQPGPARAV
jgi:glycosyltransferase involved in cell wall biosynthesis